MKTTGLIAQEPLISVGIIDHRSRIAGELSGGFSVQGRSFDGGWEGVNDGGSIMLTDRAGSVVARGQEVLFAGGRDSAFTLHDVTIGAAFHWERREGQTFRGDLRLLARRDGTIAAVNLVPLEEYLASVISSEMNPEAPTEFLKAHSIASRSWLAAMLQREERNVGLSAVRTTRKEGEVIRWYGREDHDLYDVCADDHCQRYQGITRLGTSAVADAVRSTRGVLLLHEGKVCDARFSKSCGGLTELYGNCWEDANVPYLQCVPDSVQEFVQIKDEKQAAAWIRSSPDVYCNTADTELLGRILPSSDRETRDYFRWKREYRREEMEEILHSKSGIDFGTLMDLTPVQRGPSGRIAKLKIRGTKRTVIVGKELEIRRWLSPTHLYSSAFVVGTERNASGIPETITLHGCGWGHGVGLCQIGAAVMASKGMSADKILTHYYRGASLKKMYS